MLTLLRSLQVPKGKIPVGREPSRWVSYVVGPIRVTLVFVQSVDVKRWLLSVSFP